MYPLLKVTLENTTPKDHLGTQNFYLYVLYPIIIIYFHF